VGGAQRRTVRDWAASRAQVWRRRLLLWCSGHPAQAKRVRSRCRQGRMAPLIVCRGGLQPWRWRSRNHSSAVLLSLVLHTEPHGPRSVSCARDATGRRPAVSREPSHLLGGRPVVCDADVVLLGLLLAAAARRRVAAEQARQPAVPALWYGRGRQALFGEERVGRQPVRRLRLPHAPPRSQVLLGS